MGQLSASLSSLKAGNDALAQDLVSYKNDIIDATRDEGQRQRAALHVVEATLQRGQAEMHLANAEHRE